MRNILCVRPDDRDWIRLSHYEGLDFTTPRLGGIGAPDQTPDTQAIRAAVDNVNRLRRRLQASQKLNVMLHAEKARNEALLAQVKKLIGTRATGPAAIKEEDEAGGGARQAGDRPPSQEPPAAAKPPFAFLHDRGPLAHSAGSETPLTTTTAFTLSQLQALRALSTSLRNIMPDVRVSGSSNTAGGEDDDDDEGGSKKNKSWRRERVEYVEAATRKHLENVRGLELGKNGEVRDGEWNGDGGRRLGKGEVEGLESVVAALGGSLPSSDGRGGGAEEAEGGEDRMDLS